MDDIPPDLSTDIVVPEGRSRLGLAHGFRVTIATTLLAAPNWLKRGIVDKRTPERRRAHVELIERLASALERSFRIALNPLSVFYIQAIEGGTYIVSSIDTGVVVNESFEEVTNKLKAWTK